jgi:hypothetical protein
MVSKHFQETKTGTGNTRKETGMNFSYEIMLNSQALWELCLAWDEGSP